MNVKTKIFYIVDSLIIISSAIGMIIINSKKTYGLAALSSVGNFVVLALIFLISIILLIIVLLVHFITKYKKKS